MKIAVLVSGGVDSAVSLALLKSQGYDVTAFYLKIWLEDELSFLGDCPWEEDLMYVRSVCDQLGVPLEIVPFQEDYWSKVVSYTINEVKSGRTPNPDILCNSRVKFGAFLDYCGSRFDKVASGHYANVVFKDGEYQLLMTPDPIKDQTYFLSGLSQEQLSKLICPIGTLNKSEVRELAKSYDLANKDRKDSQGICFLGKLKFKDFVKFHLGTLVGDLIEFETGKKLGAHEGFWFYTVGQRQGIGLSGGPWYVVKKDVKNNIVFISKNYYTQDKIRDEFEVRDLNWIGRVPEPTELKVKLRHGPVLNDCFVTKLDTGNFLVKLADNDQGIASGQHAVFYKDNRCLGGGIIV